MTRTIEAVEKPAAADGGAQTYAPDARLASETAASTASDGAAQKKVYVKTFGCQMNVYDSERMSEMLATGGYSATEQLEDADLVILNTCHIREKAVEKVYSDLGRIRDVKRARAAEGRDTVVTVAGCVAQAEGAEIARRAPAVDVVIGPQSYHRLPEIIVRAKALGRAQVETEFPEDDKFNHLPPRTINSPAANPKVAPRRGATAFLTVQEGCDKFCTFCVVPYTRGAEVSRPAASIVDEARRLVDQGVMELTLLGQNVNAYAADGPDGRPWSLARLIEELSRIDGLQRLRYMTSHPRDMADDLIAAHRDLPKLMPYLHLPVQSGSDRVLAAMNRRHTVAEYLALIGRIRKGRPDLALSTDIIVGFPGETEADFEQTLALLREVGYAQTYSFKYSQRPGTPAADLGGQVDEMERTRRLARLHAVIEAGQTAFNAGCIGHSLPVLWERRGRRPGQMIGRSPYLQSVYAEVPAEWLGRIMNVEITGAWPNSLTGVIKAT